MKPSRLTRIGSLEGIAQQVKSPFLVMHGKDGGITPPSEAELLFEKLGTLKKTLKIFDNVEGAAEHCQVDDRPADIGSRKTCSASREVT